MAESKRPGKRPGAHPPKGTSQRRPPSAGPLGLRPLKQGGFELVHPRCARDREEDIAEVHAMLEADEIEIAVDELRWLIGGCRDCIAAHRLLGEIAMDDGDLQLARGHFGYVFELARKSTAGRRPPVKLPYDRATNQPLLESAKGLALCLERQKKPRMALEVARQLAAWDSTDALGAKALVARLSELVRTAPPDVPDLADEE